MIKFLGCVLLFPIIVISSYTVKTAYSQIANKDQDVIAVKAILQERADGFSSSFCEKFNARLGDKVSIALRKIYTTDELLNPSNIKLYLQIIHDAFKYSEFNPNLSDRTPTVTLPLLDELLNNVKDPDLIAEIRDLRAFILDKYLNNQEIKPE